MFKVSARWAREKVAGCKPACLCKLKEHWVSALPALCKDIKEAMVSSLLPIEKCVSSTGKVSNSCLLCVSWVKDKYLSPDHTVACDLLIFCWRFLTCTYKGFRSFLFEISAGMMAVLALQKGLQRRPASVFWKRVGDSYDPFLTVWHSMYWRAGPGPVRFVNY